MKRILVPLSFSDTARNALVIAHSIAKEFNASLTLLHCYPIQEYARHYDFGKNGYDKGIRKMLTNFYRESIEDTDPAKYRIITVPGTVSDVINQISSRYDLMILGRATRIRSITKNLFTDKIFYISSKAMCPTLIVPLAVSEFSLTKANNIWLIQKHEHEKNVIKGKIDKFGIDPNSIATKSLVQKSFISNFWKNIITYTQTHEKKLLNAISESYIEEHPDLVILFNHMKGMFDIFLKGEAFQLISRFDIPILVFQQKSP